MPHLQSKVHYKSHVSAVLFRANGERIDLGDLDNRKPWWKKIIERIGFDQRGLITDQAVADICDEFTSGAPGLNAYKYHASGTSNTAAAVTDTALGAELSHVNGAPSTRPVSSSQTSSGSSSTSPATLTAVGLISYGSGASSTAIVEWGLFTSSTIGGGNMLDRRVFGAITVSNGDAIQFTYTLSVASGGS
jgi:hypothetical protein